MIFTYSRFITLPLIALCMFALTQAAFAFQTIRDAETEIMLRTLANPIFDAANLEAENVNLYLIQSNQLNAFVAGGMNIFIHTELLQYSESPETLLGVLAHETGHITGGHLIRSRDQFGALTTTTILGYLLGAATAVAGAPEVGTAIAAGTQHTAQRGFLKHSRTQEQSADYAALNFLEKLGYSPQGLLNLLQTLGLQTRQRFGDIDPYAITHPLSNERIRHIEYYMQQHPAQREIPADIKANFKRVVAKVSAFLDPVSSTLRKFPESDQSDVARYARAIAHYRQPNLTKALAEIDGLITDYPSDPFYHEMRGQMLFENGRVKEAISSYQQAETMIQNNALLKTQLATAMITTEDEQYLDKAINLLRQSLHLDAQYGTAWKQLAVAYGRQGNLGQSYLALTEQAVLARNFKDAKQYATYANEHLAADSPSKQRLIDLERTIDKEDSK